MAEKKKVHFKILKDSIVKGTGAGTGYYVCETEPPHPRALHLKDRNRTYVYVHEVVMENKLGRLIRPSIGEEVHHKDGDTFNNDPSNLELGTKTSHPREHAKTNKFWKHSPMNKAKKSSVLRVMLRHLASML